MIEFIADNYGAIINYSPGFQGGSWLWGELKSHGKAKISRVFILKRSDLLEEPAEGENTDEFNYSFRFAVRDGAYYRIPGRIFGISSDVMLDSGIGLERKLFVAERNVSIFRRLAEVINTHQDIVIGGDKDGCIPINVFKNLIDKFPNSTELDRYANARVANIIEEYFDGMKDFRAQYEAYLNRRKSVAPKSFLDARSLFQAELDKFTLIRDTLKQWLSSTDRRTEKEWQKKIIEFVLLIFPKYIAVLENVKINDYYSTPGVVKSRYIDIALVDANGNLDIIEIKRPFDDFILSNGQYRDNFVPTKDFSGTIMQAEKYLFHLSKWGAVGEESLTRKYGGSLPQGMSIRITNPKALLILGRDRKTDGSAALDQNQLFDLELIKRKYANMMDIITYDDLLRRLNNIITSLDQKLR